MKAAKRYIIGGTLKDPMAFINATLASSGGNRFKLNHIVQVPKLDVEKVQKSIIKLDLITNIKPSWTLTQIMNWAGS